MPRPERQVFPDLKRAHRLIRELATVQDCAFSMCYGPGKPDHGMTHCQTCALVRKARRYLRHLPEEK